jgi:hypothetical protein
MQIPTNHQAILDELAEKLLPQEASLTVKQVDGSLDASIRATTAKKDPQDYMYNWIRSKSGK